MTSCGETGGKTVPVVVPAANYTLSVTASGSSNTGTTVGLSCGAQSCSATGSWSTLQTGCQVSCSDADDTTLTSSVTTAAARYISKYQTDNVDTVTYTSALAKQTLSVNLGKIKSNKTFNVEVLSSATAAAVTYKTITFSVTGGARLNTSVITITCASGTTNSATM